MQFDLFHAIAAQRLANAGYRVQTDLARDHLSAFVGKLKLVHLRIKNSCVPEHKIWQAEKGAEMLRNAGKL